MEWNGTQPIYLIQIIWKKGKDKMVGVVSISFVSVNLSDVSRLTHARNIRGLQSSGRFVVRASSTESMASTIEKLGIKIERNPPESRLSSLGVRNWPKWGCPPSNFPWTYTSKETCYLLEGKVKVTPHGTNEAVEIAAGDLVVFPKGMSCTWDVSVAVDKHYNFE